ncbi:MAG: hypothetical protein WA584_19680 [Pyrinomonadaceae bacterium]
MKHPEFEKLVKSFEGLLPMSEEQEISSHLRVCALCGAQARKLESFFGYVNAGKTAPVSQADTARLLNVFKRPEKSISATGESFVERLLAGLVFDDWQTALSERFVADDSRHLLYRAGQFEIDLRLHFADGKCRLSGQVFPDCGKQASAEIFSENASEKVFLNDYCEFVFPPVAEGTYDFRIDSNGKLIEIENLSLIN